MEEFEKLPHRVVSSGIKVPSIDSAISIELRLAGKQTQHSVMSEDELRAEIVIDWE
ncbi:MAG: hypothetical protein IKJ58_01720 [Akkermansia sp.]|nr:hypothetical protein [Akkermansia sp.]